MIKNNTTSFSVSLPEPLLKQVDAMRQREHSNRSEFIRTALKKYIAQQAVSVDQSITPDERSAEMALSERGRKEYERGEVVTLGELKQELGYDMDASHHQDR